MTKLKFVPLLMLLPILAALNGSAQLSTNLPVIQKAALQAEKDQADRFRKLLSLSKQKGWPMLVRGKNGRMAHLVDVDNFGLPIYIGVNDNIISAATIKTNTIQPGG